MSEWWTVDRSNASLQLVQVDQSNSRPSINSLSTIPSGLIRPQHSTGSVRRLLSTVFTDDELQAVLDTLIGHAVSDVDGVLRLEDDDVCDWFDHSPLATRLSTLVRQYRVVDQLASHPTSSTSAGLLSSRRLCRRFEAVVRLIPASHGGTWDEQPSSFTGVLISPELVLTSLHCWRATSMWDAITAGGRVSYARRVAADSLVQLPWMHAWSNRVVTRCRPDVLFVWNESAGYCVCAVHPYLREMSSVDRPCVVEWKRLADGVRVDSFIALCSSPSRRLVERLMTDPSIQYRHSTGRLEVDQGAKDDGSNARADDSNTSDEDATTVEFSVQQYGQPQLTRLLSHSCRQRPPLSQLSRHGRQLLQYSWQHNITMGSPLLDEHGHMVGLHIADEQPRPASSGVTPSTGWTMPVLYTIVPLHVVVDDLLDELLVRLRRYGRCTVGMRRLHIARQCVLLVQAVAFEEGENMRRRLLAGGMGQQLDELMREVRCSVDELQQVKVSRLVHVQLLPALVVLSSGDGQDEEDNNSVIDEQGVDWLSPTSPHSVASPAAISSPLAEQKQWVARLVRLCSEDVAARFLDVNAGLLDGVAVMELSIDTPGPVDRIRLSDMRPMFHVKDEGEREQWLCEHVYTTSERRILLTIALASSKQQPDSETSDERPSEALCKLARRLVEGSEVRWPDGLNEYVDDVVVVPCAPLPAACVFTERAQQLSGLSTPLRIMPASVGPLPTAAVEKRARVIAAA